MVDAGAEGRLARVLHEAIDRCSGGPGRPTILYSGGLDSSVVAWVLRARGPRLLTIGVPSSPDLVAARSGARALDLPLMETPVDLDDVTQALERWRHELDPLPEPSRSVAVSMALALAATPEGRVICGQGADELFLGYAHFRGLGEEAARARQTADWHLLADRDWPLAQRVARSLDRELVSPYLDPAVVAAVRAQPLRPPPASETLSKTVLREVARQLGVPVALADRPKKAMQYGSGVARLVRALDRRRDRDPPSTRV